MTNEELVEFYSFRRYLDNMEVTYRGLTRHRVKNTDRQEHNRARDIPSESHELRPKG